MICCLLCPCYCPTRSRLICWPGHCAQSREAGGAPSTRSGASDAKESYVHTYMMVVQHACSHAQVGIYYIHTYICTRRGLPITARSERARAVAATCTEKYGLGRVAGACYSGYWLFGFAPTYEYDSAAQRTYSYSYVPMHAIALRRE